MSANEGRLELSALQPFPKVRVGDNLSLLITRALDQMSVALSVGDSLVLAQKIVSKAEGRSVRLDSVEPLPRAIELAKRTAKDPRLVELILRESSEVIRVGSNVIVVEHRFGFVLANAGIDQSNVSDDGGARKRCCCP